MKIHSSYELSSHKRTVPMYEFAKGLSFSWEPLMAAIEQGTFDPNDFDMLHALNWMKRHLNNYGSHSTTVRDTLEQAAATQAWCLLYPYAPKDVQAHMTYILNDASQPHIDTMRQNPLPWSTCMEKTWALREDYALWDILCTIIPDSVKDLPFQATTLDHAFKLMQPHIHEWTKKATAASSLSCAMYDVLVAHSTSALQQKIETFRLLYPVIEDMPHARVLFPTWNALKTQSPAEDFKLQHFKQMASNLLQWEQCAMESSKEMTFDLPTNAFGFQP